MGKWTGVLFDAIPLTIGIVALYLEVLTVTAGGSLATTFCLAVSTWFASMCDPMSAARFGSYVARL